MLSQRGGGRRLPRKRLLPALSDTLAAVSQRSYSAALAPPPPGAKLGRLRVCGRDPSSSGSHRAALRGPDKDLSPVRARGEAEARLTIAMTTEAGVKLPNAPRLP